MTCIGGTCGVPSGRRNGAVEDAVFECLFVLGQPVLLPSVVKDATVEVVPSNARLKETVASPVVGLLFKFECATVLHELSKFRWVTPAELFKRSLDLLLLNSVVLFVLAATWQTLPWERSLDEVENNVTDCLQIISSTLFDTLVCGNRSISGGTSQVFAILVGDVLTFAVLVAFG